MLRIFRFDAENDALTYSTQPCAYSILLNVKDHGPPWMIDSRQSQDAHVTTHSLIFPPNSLPGDWSTVSWSFGPASPFGLFLDLFCTL